MKRLLSVSMLALSIFFVFIASRHAPQSLIHASQPRIYAASGIAIDARTGQVLYTKREHALYQPGSVSKMMTALLLLENARTEEEIEITTNALSAERQNKKIILQPGERLKRDEAIKLLLVISADPVSAAIAEHISGSEDKFASLMNERANQLGLHDSSFKNASGSQVYGQRASAYDLALITKEALRYPQVLSCLGTVTVTIHTSMQQTDITNNGRKQLFQDPHALGSKSGRTNIDGYTLVTVHEQNGKRVIVVVLGGDKEHLYEDARLIAQHALVR